MPQRNVMAWTCRVQRRTEALCIAAVLSLLYCAQTATALDAQIQLGSVQLKDMAGFKPVQMTDLPDIFDEVESKVTKTGRIHINGLVSTINYDTFKKRSPDTKEETLKLKPEETGFAREIEVRLYRQPGRAPLAVTLLGFGQSCNDKVARAWQTYLYESGCHVLTFDSLIRNNMNEASGHGVAGNFVEEAHIITKIVDATLAQRKQDMPLRDNVSSVRLLGTSYGGLLALQCLRETGAGTWPIDRCLILSIPVNMSTTARRLDSFAREDKPFFGLLSLMKLMHGFTPQEEQPNAKEEALMRAGIGYVFHGDLDSFAKSNIHRYDPELPNRLNAWVDQPEQRQLQKEMLDTLEARQAAEDKELEASYAGNKPGYDKAREELKARHKIQKLVAKRQPNNIGEWNFQDYVFLLLKPYWKLKRGSSTPVTLEKMLIGAPNFVQVFIAADDPLNDMKEVDEYRKLIPEPRLNVIPHGGHLGYTGTHWTETLVTKFFAADKDN